MKSNFLKSALALLLCLTMVLLPSVTALAADIPALNLDENGGYTAPAENAPESENAKTDNSENTADVDYDENEDFVDDDFLNM